MMEVLTLEEYLKFGHYLINQNENPDFDKMKQIVSTYSVCRHKSFGAVEIIGVEPNKTGQDKDIPYVVIFKSDEGEQKQNILAFVHACKIKIKD